jgi:predicted transcriptional regulator
LVEIEWTNTRKRRDRLHIMAEVLEVTVDGALKTQVMYKANLSFAQLNEYLSLLLELGLLKTKKMGQKTVYKTTRKGSKYLKGYEEIKGFLTKQE